MSCKALVLYCSITGNTRKVAETIHATLEGHGVSSELMDMRADSEVDVFSYELVFIGAPVYHNLAPKPAMNFLEKLRKSTKHFASAPEKPRRFAVMYCTYGGGHTGVGEAIPLLKYMGQVFEHEGMRVVEEWPIVGDFPKVKDPNYNFTGRFGEIMGRPNEADLKQVAGQTSGVLRRLQHKLGIEELVAGKDE